MKDYFEFYVEGQQFQAVLGRDSIYKITPYIEGLDTAKIINAIKEETGYKCSGFNSSLTSKIESSNVKEIPCEPCYFAQCIIKK